MTPEQLRNVAPFALYHNHGCGEIAILAKREIKFGEPVLGDDFLWLDGSQVERSDSCRCDSCDEFLAPSDFIPEFLRKW